MAQFDQETRQLEQAAEQLARDRAALLRPDGQPRYVPDEFAAYEQAAEARFNATADGIFAAVERQATAAERELQALTLSDPLDRLSADEQQQASVRAPFVREDVETMSLPALADRCTALLAVGSTVDQVLWARYAHRRLDALVEAGRARPQGRSPSDIAEAEALHGVLQQLDAALADPQAAARRSAAEQTQQAAREWGSAAHQRRAEIDGTIAKMVAALHRHHGRVF